MDYAGALDSISHKFSKNAGFDTNAILGSNNTINDATAPVLNSVLQRFGNCQSIQFPVLNKASS